jgi:hypothetical protein
MSKRTFNSEQSQVSQKEAKKGNVNTLTAHSFAPAFTLSSTAFSVSLALSLALSSYVLPTLINPAYADGPKGGVVVGGRGDISKIDTTTIINQASQNMAINWDSYNVAANETVHYVQPNASAISLNRILGVNGSTIAGQIQSNGQVILINPNGLVFTGTSVLNVGGIIASGLDMSPTDFMNGDYIFNELSFNGSGFDGSGNANTTANGTVINRGIINAALGGNVALIGKQVINEGLIEATLGTVTLAAGKQAVLTFDTGGLLGVKVSKAILQDELGVDPALINSGEINAKGGRVLLTASASREVFSQAVNSGLEQATSVVINADGSFSLGGGADVLNSGTVDVSSFEASSLELAPSLDLASNTSGAGQIVVLGENITSSGKLLANVTANVTTNATASATSYHAGDIELHAQDTLKLTEQSITLARGTAYSMAHGAAHSENLTHGSAAGIAGAAGGTIKALGDKVGLFDNAIIDASGSQGGAVYIGGDVQGLNPLMPNAKFTYLGENSQIHADGLSANTAFNTSPSLINSSGNGGKVIVFAQDTSRVYGQLSATGGLDYGDGGFIETSGLKGFDIQTVPQVTAANGQGGEWLIDPNDITIVAGSTSSNINNDTPPINSPFDATGIDAELGVNLIFGALTGGATVTVTTTDGDIYWGDSEGSPADLDFNNTGSNTLILNAGNSIFFVNGEIKDSNPLTTDLLNLNLNAKTNGAVDEGIVELGGIYDIVTIPTAFDFKISTGGGSFISNSTSFESTEDSFVNTTGTRNQDGGAINISAFRDITAYELTANGGSANRNGGVGVVGRAGGNITLTSVNGNVLANQAISAVGTTGSFETSEAKGENGGDGGDILFTATAGSINTVALTTTGGAASGNNTTSGTGNSINEANGGHAGTITLDAATGVTVSGILNAVGGVGVGQLHSGNQGVGGNGGNVSITANTVTLDANINASVGVASSGALAGTTEGIASINLSGASGIATIGYNSAFTTKVNIAQGGGATGSQTLVRGINSGLQWIIDGVNTGHWLTSGGSVLNLAFAGIENLTGSNSTDVFDVTEAGSMAGTINGGGGTNTLKRTNASGVNTWLLSGANQGTLNSNVFQNIQTIIGSTNNSVVDTLTGSSQNNSWQVSGTDAGSVAQTISPMGTINFSEIENITGGTGDDTFTLDNGDSISGTISGGSGGTNRLVTTNNAIANIWQLTGANQGTLNINQTFSNMQMLVGSTSTNRTDTLTGLNQNNNWQVTGANAGSVENATSSADKISFSGIENITGGSGNDNFTLGEGASISGTINGGTGGINSLARTNTTGINAWLLNGVHQGTLNGRTFENIQTVIGSGSTNAGVTDTLTALSQNNNWQVTGANAGSVEKTTSPMDTINFSNINNITGRGLNDNFTLGQGGSISGTIDGGGGTNILTRTNTSGTNTWLLSGFNQGMLNSSPFRNIQTIVGSTNIGVTDTLTGRNQTNNWQISGINTGSISDINFSDIDSIIGGNQSDIFNFSATASITAIQGGSGNNKIVARDVDNEWHISGSNSGALYQDNDAVGFGAAYLNSFTDIQTLRGSDSNLDIFVMGSAGSISTSINGGIGTNNTLVARQGVINTWDFNSLTSGSLTQFAPSELYVDSFVNIQKFVGGNAGGEWANLSTFTSSVNVENYFGFTGIIGNGSNSALVGQNGVANTWQIDSVLDEDGNDTEGTNDGTFTNSNGSLSFIDFVTLTGGDSTDNFTIANTGSFTGTMNGGGGIDTLQVKDAAINTWVINGVGTGNISDAETIVTSFTFTDINNLVGGTNIDNFTLNSMSYISDINGFIDGGAGNDSVNITGNIAQDITLGTDILGVETLTANVNAINTLRVVDTTNEWTIRGANGGIVYDADTSLYFTDFVNFNALIGGNKVDNFKISELSSGTWNGTIDGGLGTNTLFGRDTANTWTIDNDNAGNLAYLVGVTTGFTNIANVVGGAVVDTFTVSAALNSLVAGGGNDVMNLDNINRVTTAIDGGDGDDTVNISTANQTVNLVTDITRIENVNGTSSNILQSGDTNNTWNVTSDNRGTLNDNVTLVNFTNFNELIGGGGIDIITLSAQIASLNTGAGDDIINIDELSHVTNTIDGGLNNDTLNISVGNQTIELGNGLTGIEVLNGTGSNTLHASNADNTWTITGTNQGTVNDTINQVSFNNFSTLIGGDLTDNFILSAINQVSGLIDGGMGTDSVQLTTADQTVILGTDITNIENLTGKAGTNTLQATNVNNIWAITSNNKGTVAGTAFTNFSNLVGGTADDSFTLNTMNQISGVIDGGAGPGTNSVRLATANQHIILETDITRINTLVAAIGNNTLQAHDIDNDWLITGANKGTVAGVSFSNISDLVGGSAIDSFTLSTIDNISGVIDGGIGGDSLTLTSANQTVMLNTDIIRLESLNAIAGAGTLIANNEANTWVIDTSDGGTITNTDGGMSFKGFANLMGGNGVDTFTVSGASGDLSGLMDGAGGSDSLILSNVNDRIIELGSDVTGNFNVNNIESITANKSATNTLLADNVENVWLIDGNEAGSITYSGITTLFSNFEHLIGGSNVDKFTVNAGGVTSIDMGLGNDTITSTAGVIALVKGNDGDDTFTLSGGSLDFMQGGAGTDFVTYNLDNVVVTLGDTLVGFEGVSAEQGNGIINAQDNVTTTWTIDEVNQGSVSDLSADTGLLLFSGFANVNGGSGIDNFIVKDNGVVTGMIDGGANNDTLTVNLDSVTRTQTGVINFTGGLGNDVVTIEGSGGKFSESYNPGVVIDTEQYDQLTFAKNNSSVNVDINYRAVETVNDMIETTALVLNNALASDPLSISGTSFGANSALVNVTYASANKGDITVLASNNSNVVITESMEVNGDLSITANDITQTAGTVTAQRLMLDGVALVGSAGDGIEINVDELFIQNHSGEIYLNEQDDIALNGLNNTTGLVSITSATGTITSDNILMSTADLALTAATDINLQTQNTLTGVLSLSAGNDIVVNNNGVTTIATLTATNATINSTQTLAVTGDMNVASASSAANADDGVLRLTSTQGEINLSGNTLADSLNMNAANDINVASVNAKSVTATSATGNIIGTGSVIVQHPSLALSTTLSAENGIISFDNAANDFDGVSLVANSAVITDQNGLALTSALLTDSLIVNANGDVALGTITAGTSVAIDAGLGAITSQASYITTPTLTLRASAGIGSGNYEDIVSGNSNNGVINTNTATLSAINALSGIVNINNSQTVTITDLRNNGDIVLANAGDISLQVSEIDGTLAGAINANYGQDINNSVYSGQVAILNDGTNSIFTTGIGFSEADITAESLLINGVSSFGTIVQPIRLRVNDKFTLIGVLASVNYFGANPRTITTSQGLTLQVVSTITGLSGQQLVEVESLDDVDPAIFADVRNYNVDEISVLLPKDQREDEEDDEYDESEYDEGEE